MSVLRWLPGVLLLLPWLVGPLAPANDVRIRGLAGPAGFRLLDWETVHLAEQLTALGIKVEAIVDNRQTVGQPAASGNILTAHAVVRANGSSQLRSVQVARLNDAGTDVQWDVTNKKGAPVASGVYIYQIKNQFSEKRGKLIIVR